MSLLISSFTRIISLESDKGGGTAGSKQVASGKDASVSVSPGGRSALSSPSGSGAGGDGVSETFATCDMKAAIGPGVTQEEAHTRGRGGRVHIKIICIVQSFRAS